MTFPELEQAIREWASEGTERLARLGAREIHIDFAQWARDEDGVFRQSERPAEIWSRSSVASLQELKSWHRVEEAFRKDPKLNRHVDTLVGGAGQGAARFDPFSAAVRLLPKPHELAQAEALFVEHYAELDNFLAAEELDYTVVWPLSCLETDALPLQLEPDVDLDSMSDLELTVALECDLIRPQFPGIRVFYREHANLTRARYTFQARKVFGEKGVADSRNETVPTWQRISLVKSALEECLALALSRPVMTEGQMVFRGRSSPTSPVSYQHTRVPLRRVEMNSDQATTLQEIWTFVRDAQLMERNKALALALRRMSYQAQRERPEDELLDLMIAAEALYLADLGNESYRGELRYRLSLRAALWSERDQTGFDKREVLDLMRAAYDVRSAIAHGGTPKPTRIRAHGERVELHKLVEAVRAVVTAGCRRALMETARTREAWKPDWDELALGNEASKPLLP